MATQSQGPETVQFAHSVKSKALARLTYSLAAPAGAIMLGIFAAGPIEMIGESQKFNPERVNFVSLTVFAAVAMGTLWWAIRNYRRRVAREVVIFADRVEVNQGKGRSVIPFDDICEIRLRDIGSAKECRLVTDAGQIVALPVDVAPYDEVSHVLIPRVTPFLERRLQNTLYSGDAVDVREDVAMAYLRVVGGACLLVVSPFWHLLITPFLSLANAKSSIEATDYAMRLIRQGLCGRHGGFVIA